MMQEIETKKCFKCGRDLPLSEFYKHSRMADGHLNKCKDCTRNDVRRDYERKSKDESWLEKERARGREKNRRLYTGASFRNKTRKDFPDAINSRRAIKIRGYNTDGKEVHHWNYNKPRSVILLSPKAHHRIHKHIIASREDCYCYTLDGVCLDTEDKTLKYYKEVLSKYDDLDEKLEIINY